MLDPLTAKKLNDEFDKVMEGGNQSFATPIVDEVPFIQKSGTEQLFILSKALNAHQNTWLNKLRLSFRTKIIAVQKKYARYFLRYYCKSLYEVPVTSEFRIILIGKPTRMGKLLGYKEIQTGYYGQSNYWRRLYSDDKSEISKNFIDTVLNPIYRKHHFHKQIDNAIL